MILFNFNAMGKLCRLHLLLLALLLPGVSFAQNLFKVQGCVTDEQNEPLIGATVQTIDKSKGTITDSSGNYVLSGVPRVQPWCFRMSATSRKKQRQHRLLLMLFWNRMMKCLMKWLSLATASNVR